MNETQRAAAERLADDLQRFDGTERESLRDEAAALLRELAEVPVQEPVGWLHDETGDFEPSHKPWMDDDEEWVPLYAAPQQPMRCPEDGGACGAGGYCRPEPQQRKPLTDEKIKALVLETVYEGDSRTPHRDAWSAEIGIPFARAVERAHGITGEPT